MAVGGTQGVREFMLNLETPKPKGPYIWTQSVELRLRVGEENKL